MTLVVNVTAAPTGGTDELLVYLPDRGVKLGGWTEVSATLRMEGFPPTFDVALSSREPGGATFTIAAEGDACEIYLGDDLIITGYVDRLSEGGSAGSHALRLTGRGRTQDLVDCSAEWSGGQIPEASALDIATKLALPYGISVELGPDAEAGPQVPSFALTLGETAADIVQRVARAAGLLAYEDERGRLLLAKLGDEQASTGVAYGQNVEAWGVERSMDGRYSDIVCTSGPTEVAFSDVSGPGSFFYGQQSDPNVPRHRLRYEALQMAATDGGAVEFTKLVAAWELARRAGRSLIATATVDSWRDGVGVLWRPNTLMPVSLPGLPSAMVLCLSEVTFRRGEDGTHADLVLCPRQAFLPEPISLQPVAISDVSRVAGQ